MFNNDFDREFKSAKRGMIGLSILAIVLNLIFWLGLIGGGIWLLKYFGVF